MLIGLAVVGAVALGVGAWILSRPKVTPAERERRRRLEVNARGRMADATLIDIRDAVLYYAYTVRGLEYTASQDVSGLHEYLPADPAILRGHASVKYLPENPANSIVLCEEWSGLYTRPPADPTQSGTAAQTGPGQSR